MEQFITASKMKIRFDTQRGFLTVEDLWDLPLDGGKVNLDAIAMDLYRQIKEQGTKSFVNKTKLVNNELQTKFDIVVYIIETRLEEGKREKEAAIRKEKKNQILDIIVRKENKDLEEKSIDDLKELLKTL